MSDTTTTGGLSTAITSLINAANHFRVGDYNGGVADLLGVYEEARASLPAPTGVVAVLLSAFDEFRRQWAGLPRVFGSSPSVAISAADHLDRLVAECRACSATADGEASVSALNWRGLLGKLLPLLLTLLA